MKESIDTGTVFHTRQLSLKECEEYFDQLYTFIETKHNKKLMYDCEGKVIGYITITDSSNLKDFK